MSAPIRLPTSYTPGYTPEDDGQPQEMGRAQWLERMRGEWMQGQHIAIMGRTGRGKTMLARDLMALRGWVAVVAIKHADDTIDTFPRLGYKIINRWPPNWGDQHVVLWAKPKRLSDQSEQRARIIPLFDDIFENGGWAVLFDDVARMANALGFKKDISTLLGEARSSFTSVVSCMTQPSSVTQAIPSEVWRQVRFHLVFYYRVGRDLDAISDIVGYDKKTVKSWMSQLRPFDFLAFDDLTDSVTIVRT